MRKLARELGMPELIAEKTDLPEWPDLEDFMTFCQESRIDGATMKILAELWAKWLGLLQIFRIVDGKKSWIGIWLPEEIERETDRLWAESPTLGYLANALAQFLCMSAAREKLPQVADFSCAPAPEPVLALKNGLAQAGLEADPETGVLKRRYAIVTWHPFRGGCEICSLRENCPKGSVGNDFASIVLPGHERAGSQ